MKPLKEKKRWEQNQINEGKVLKKSTYMKNGVILKKEKRKGKETHSTLKF